MKDSLTNSPIKDKLLRSLPIIQGVMFKEVVNEKVQYIKRSKTFLAVLIAGHDLKTTTG